MTKPKKVPAGKRGPKPETLVIEANWKDAVKQALAKGKPPSPANKSNTSKKKAAKTKRPSK